MIIKKFQAKTENEAVENAKKELGNGVVIMNVRNVKKKGLPGLFGRQNVEVTVALEEENERQYSSRTAPFQEEPTPPPMTALEQLAKVQERAMKQKLTAQENSAAGSTVVNNALEEKLDSLETLLKKQLDSDEKEKEKEKEKENTESKGEEPEEEESEQIQFMKLLYNTMIDNEVNEKYANQIIEEAEKNAKPNMPFDYCLVNIYQKMILRFGQAKIIEPSEEGPKVVFFVGPTGVGKTTTIAKVASKKCVDEKKKVALLTTDTYRIAAAEQLRTYANILEVPFRIIYSPAEIETAYHEFENFDYIFVDTAGHSHHNEEQKENSNIMIHSLDELTTPEVYLVLSATTKYRDLVSIADTYKQMTDYKLIFTKLDETTSLGNLLNLRLYTGASMSYVTCGQNVPEDIECFNPQTTVKQILGGKQND